MKSKQNNIVLCQKMISFCSDLFSFRVPELFFIEDNKKTFHLMDSHLKSISYDSRSLDQKVETIYFDYKRYQMYINIDILKQSTTGLIIILREMRHLYQLCQIQKLRKNQKVDEDRTTVQQWRHAYQVMVQHRFQPEPIIELDKNAFAKYIIYNMFDMEVKFKVLSKKMFREYIERMELKYDPIMLVDLAEKHKIKTRIARYFNLDDFQVEILSGSEL